MDSYNAFWYLWNQRLIKKLLIDGIWRLKSINIDLNIDILMNFKTTYHRNINMQLVDIFSL